jgi:hypothetical protein
MKKNKFVTTKSFYINIEIRKQRQQKSMKNETLFFLFIYRQIAFH